MKTLIILLVVSLLAISPIIAYNTDTYVEFTVNSKERIQSDDSSKYLIFTDNGVYQNTDTVWYWKFNSSDVYNDLKVGDTYTARVYGFRIPFLSMYKNIINVNK